MSGETRFYYSKPANELYTTFYLYAPNFILLVTMRNFLSLPCSNLYFHIRGTRRTVHLKAHCVKSCEFPAFFVNHDNTLAIPGTCDSQFSQEDHALLNMLGQSICPLPAELSITVSCFFQRIKCFWLMDNTSSSPSVVGLVPGCCM